MVGGPGQSYAHGFPALPHAKETQESAQEMGKGGEEESPHVRFPWFKDCVQMRSMSKSHILSPH